MSIVTSVVNYQNTEIQQLILPKGFNLSDPVLRSSFPYQADFAFDLTSSKLFYGDGTNWLPLDVSGSITVSSPIAAVDNNVLHLTATDLNAEFADLTHNGVISNTTQSFGGTKTFTTVNVSNNLNIATDQSTATDGIIKKGGQPFLHNFAMGAGQDNLFLGINSGNFTLTGNNLVGIGDSTLQSITSGTNNVAFGSSAGSALTTGSHNVCMGIDSLSACTTGSSCVGIGNSSLENSNGSNNTAMGDNALSNTTNTDNNVGVGANTGSTGSRCTVLGTMAGLSGDDNTCGGYTSLQGNSGNQNSVFGSGSMSAIGCSGHDNSSLGYQSLKNITTGSNNISAGSGSGINQTTGSNNIYLANAGVATENGIIRFGIGGTHNKNFQAGIRGVSSDAGDAIACYISSTGQLCTSGSNTYTTVPPINPIDNNAIVISNSISGTNTIGLEFADATHNGILSTVAQTIAGTKQFSNVNITGTLETNNISEFTTDAGIQFSGNRIFAFTGGFNSNVVIGSLAGEFLFPTPSTDNILIGSTAGQFMNNAFNNIALGTNALGADHTSSSNISIGSGTLNDLVSGNGKNICIGDDAGAGISTGEQNICIGYHAGQSLATSNSFNTSVGSNSLASATVSNLSAFGRNSLTANTTGTGNSAFGVSSLATNITGNNSCAFGSSALAV